MVIHSVYFWLTDEARDTQAQEVELALHELGRIDLVQAAYIGVPAGTAHRDVTDHSFDFALILHFASQADHDAYQDHPVHHDFVKAHKSKWRVVKVRDTEVRSPA